jgi:uncharacterized YigZ family protein
MTVRQTLAAANRFTLEVRKSRFLAHAAPVDTPEAAMDALAAMSDPAATHNCWAYRIADRYRSSDDGEPGGTAGRPILAAIDGSGLDRLIVVVTRWYGGVKLGAGGLVRAYGGAAAECLRTTPKVELVQMRALRLQCEFAIVAAIHALLREHGAEKLGERFDADGAEFRLAVPADRSDAFAAAVGDLSRGRAQLSFGAADVTQPAARDDA